MEEEYRGHLRKLAMVLVLLIGIAFTNSYMRNTYKLKDYKNAALNTAMEYHMEQGRYLRDYASVIFPKYAHYGAGGQNEENIALYTFEFVDRLYGNTILYNVPFYNWYLLENIPADAVTSDEGIDFLALGVQPQDLEPQEHMPELENEFSYMLTVDLRKEYTPDADGNLGFRESAGLVRLDAFRLDMYNEKVAQQLGPAYEGYRLPEELAVWYGMHTLGTGNYKAIAGIDEAAVQHKVSAEQVAADYFNIFSLPMQELSSTNNIWLGDAAHEIHQNGGYIQCLLLTGSGADIKEYMQYAQTAGYAVRPLRILDSDIAEIDMEGVGV